MSELEDAKVSQRYRALGREEPGAALDAAILAAARRAAGSRPGGVRAGLRRWALPVSVAAVVVLSATVTLQMQRERPDAVALYVPEPKQIEQSAAREAPPATLPSAALAPQSEAPKEQRKAAKADLARQATTLGAGRASQPAAAEPAPRRDEVRPAPAPESRARPFAADPSASPAQPAAGRIVPPSPASADSVADRTPAAVAPAQSESIRSAESAAGARPSNEALPRNAPAMAEMRAKSGEKDESPERWLERIVALRAAGREREADESFAAFRKRYPDYKISEEMLGKLKGKP